MQRYNNTNKFFWNNLSYAYDPVGNVATIEDGVANQTQGFKYDDLDRLTSASASNGEGAYAEAYQYFRGGNFQRKGLPDNDTDGLYAHGDPEHVHAVTSYRDNTYGYDANGNMITRTVSSTAYELEYDGENRLIGVEGGGPTVTFTYDGDGNRVKKDEGGVVTLYPGRHYESTIGSGSTKYYYADGQPVFFERSPDYGVDYGRRYVFRDHLGSTSVILNGKGEKLWEDRYLPFGDVRYTYRREQEPGQDIVLQTQFRYTGQWFEDGVGAPSPVGSLGRGLYFYGARWYDSSLGRFLQPDTIVPEPGNPQSLNRYTYANNNALRYTDPTGYLTEDELKTLLGDNYDTLMALWEQYDPYFVTVLQAVTAGGYIAASMLGDIELHFEGSGTSIQSTVYNGDFSNKLWDWQGKGAYTPRSPGQSTEEAVRQRDDLFNAYENIGGLVTPVFDYHRVRNGIIQPTYLGARMINQSVGDWQWSTASGELAKAGGLPPAFGGYAKTLGTIGAAAKYGVRLGAGGATIALAVDVAIGSVYASYQSPKRYSSGWPGYFGRDINHNIPLN